MKPSFALDLRDERVTLLHRTSRGWQEVGSTRFDAPDLAEALAYMRSTALGLSPRGISTKVVIPNDQILYTTVTAPGPDAAKRKRQVKAALDGLTPYALDEIVYDTQGTGPEVQVAVVAKITLAEAEAFAAEHRFNPVSFVAVPDPGGFAGEPFFGPSAMSPSLLAEGEKVERDSQPIEIVARDLPRAEAKPEPEPEPAQASRAEAAAATDAERAAEPAAPVADRTPSVQQAELPLPETAAPVAPSAAAGQMTPMPAVPEAAMPEVATPEPGTAAQRVGTASERAPAAPAPAPEPRDPAPAPVDEAPMALDVPSDEAPAPAMTPAALKSSLAPVTPVRAAEPAEDDLPPAPSAALRAVLAARRNEQTARGPNVGAAAPRPVSTVRPVGAIEPNAGQGKTGATEAPAAAASARAKTLVGGKPAKAGAMITAPSLPGDGRRKSTAQLTVVPSGSAPAEPAKPAQAAKAQSSGKPLTGLGGRSAPARGRPRFLGLILTGILLVFLALIAAWTSYVMPRATSDAVSPAPTALSQAAEPGGAPNPDAAAATPGLETAMTAAEPPAAAEMAAPDAGASAATDTPSVADEAAADGQDAEVAAATETDAATAGAADALAAAATESATALPAATAAASVETTPDPAATAAVGAEATAPAQAAAEPAPGTAVSTEAASGTSAGDTAGDEIFLAAAEPPTELPDPAALPGVAPVEDSLPQAAASPPPFGTIYKFDDQGRILPTPQGVVTPEGVTLVAGKPPRVPPDRPAAIAALAPAPAPAAVEAPATAPATAPGAIPLTAVPDATTAPTTGESTAPFPSDPALKDFRPKARPANLVPTVAEPPTHADPRLAGFRPRGRSAAVAAQAPAPAAAPASDAASTAGLNGAAQPTVVSAMAVDVSRLPPARPAALAQAVNAAVNQAVAEATPPANDTSASGGGGDSEPEPVAAAPNIPSNASVAKTATEKDVLAMNKLTLIGIFGSDSARYAYVRLSNGALKKVKVGDALDGGTVVAISATDLRYQKNGKVITLAMPREG